MNAITATKARSNLFQILKKSIKEHSPVRVSCKEGSVILIAEEDFESLMETAELLQEPGLKASIKKADKEISKGDVYSFDEIFKEG